MVYISQQKLAQSYLVIFLSLYRVILYLETDWLLSFTAFPIKQPQTILPFDIT
jgi:hypothetical protein